MRFHLWRLSRGLFGGRRWYQYIEFEGGLTTERWGAGELKPRTSSFRTYLEEQFELTQDDIVVDIGSNAGLFTLLTAQHCKHAFGVEIDKGFDRQARFLKKKYGEAGLRVDNVTFIRGSITEHLDIMKTATVILASKILYHDLLGGGLDEMMEAIENGMSRVVLMQGHSVPARGPLGTDDGMRRLFEKYGFHYELSANVPEFPIATATRRTGL